MHSRRGKHARTELEDSDRRAREAAATQADTDDRSVRSQHEQLDAKHRSGAEQSLDSEGRSRPQDIADVVTPRRGSFRSKRPSAVGRSNEPRSR